jgi:hypothetical protein
MSDSPAKNHYEKLPEVIAHDIEEELPCGVFQQCGTFTADEN